MFQLYLRSTAVDDLTNKKKMKAAGPKPAAPSMKLPDALLSQPVPIDANCGGERWVIEDADRLARLIAIVAMGQAMHAANIIHELQPASPAFTHKALFDAARRQLRIVGKTEEKKDASRWQRDGFLFEAISWVAARQSSAPNTYLKDPHLKSTTQGIDGLMIEMDGAKAEVTRATIFEDKCSNEPRTMFRDEVLRTFKDHHRNSRAPELVSTAATLIEQSGLLGSAAVAAASRVLDLAYRRYLAALTVAQKDDTPTRRQAIFKDYDELDAIGQQQRIGASLIVNGDLRENFDDLAARTIAVLDNWEAKEA